METKKNKKVIEVEENIYVACDGNEFSNYVDCIRYEKEILLKEFISKVEKLKIKELDEQPPISCTYVNDDNSFRWYQIKNKNDFENLEEAYQSSFSYPSKFPEIYCIETMGHEPYQDDSYDYPLTDMINVTKGFWEKLGYTVEFKQVEEWKL